jgi:hypothetical protein
VKDLFDYTLVCTGEIKKSGVRRYGEGYLSESIEIEVYTVFRGIRDMVIGVFRSWSIVVVIFHDDGGAGSLRENTALLYFHSRNHAEMLS